MTPSTPDVLLSMTVLRPEEKLLLAAMRARGLTVLPALAEDLSAVVSGQVAPPSLALVRNLSHREASGTASRLEHLGVPTVNRASTIEVCNDKGMQSLAFTRHGIAHPRSVHAFSYAQVRQAVAAFGWPAVLKPVSGSWGRGVTKVVDEDCLEAWIGGRESVDPAGKLFPVLVQQHVDKPGHDLRVVVVGHSPVVALRRVSDNWRTNTHLGGRVERTALTPDVERLCAQVVGLLGDGVYGVDLVEDLASGRLYVLEVNANPDFARSSAVHGVDVAGRVADYLADRANTDQVSDRMVADRVLNDVAPLVA